jgi:hypothetical protein
MVREAGQLQVGKHEGKGATGGNGKGGGGGGGRGNDPAGKSSNGGPQLQQQALVGRDVDDLIMEEREQDILRLNRDVALVNEMFKYVHAVVHYSNTTLFSSAIQYIYILYIITRSLTYSLLFCFTYSYLYRLTSHACRDMAEIIDKQGEMVQEIHASTEASRDRAEVGLDEVKKAADYQPVCIIS